MASPAHPHDLSERPRPLCETGSDSPDSQGGPGMSDVLGARGGPEQTQVPRGENAAAGPADAPRGRFLLLFLRSRPPPPRRLSLSCISVLPGAVAQSASPARLPGSSRAPAPGPRLPMLCSRHRPRAPPLPSCSARGSFSCLRKSRRCLASPPHPSPPAPDPRPPGSSAASVFLTVPLLLGPRVLPVTPFLSHAVNRRLPHV